MKERYRQLYNSAKIQERIGKIATAITKKYSGENEEIGDNPLFIQLMRGAQPFTGRLMTEIANLAPEFITDLDSMATSREPGEETKITQGLLPQTVTKDRRVVLLDGVFDIGKSATTVRNHLLGNMGARSVELAVLVTKKAERGPEIILPDYVGFANLEGWLVGMGMHEPDGKYQWSDGIWVVEQEQPQFQHAILPV